MLAGKNIILRTIRKEDLDVMFDLMNDATEKGDFWNLRLWSMPDLEKKFNENFFWNDDNGWMLIVDKKDGRPLGTIGFLKNPPTCRGMKSAIRFTSAPTAARELCPKR